MSVAEHDVARLGADGFFVAASFLGARLAKDARTAATALVARGALKRAGVRRGAQHHLDGDVRGDSTAWLDDVTDPPWPEVRERFDGLRRALNETAYLGLRRIELQLAHYPGTGARYARHRDAFPGDENRRLTAIVYLNPEWTPAHGGQLLLHVDPPTTVEPRDDVLVVFRSELVEHEVLPSFADRLALTAWYSAR